jgi:hypothetical protein
MGKAKQVPMASSSKDSFSPEGVYALGTEQERWLVLPDMQIPEHDERSVDAVLEYAATQRWDGMLQIGDFLDFAFCSRWTVDNARKVEGSRFLKEYEYGNLILDKIQNAVRKKNPDAKMVVLEGNHDARVEAVVDKTPALEGLIEFESNLKFEERNALYWRYWSHRKPIVIGKAYFIHGEYLGTHHAKKTAESYGRSVFYGHTHTLQAYTKTTLAEDSVQAWSIGTLSRFDLDYMGKRPSSWQQGFAEFFFRPDGSFNHYFTNIFDHTFTASNGKTYQG